MRLGPTAPAFGFFYLATGTGAGAEIRKPRANCKGQQWPRKCAECTRRMPPPSSLPIRDNPRNSCLSPFPVQHVSIFPLGRMSSLSTHCRAVTPMLAPAGPPALRPGRPPRKWPRPFEVQGWPVQVRISVFGFPSDFGSRFSDFRFTRARLCRGARFLLRRRRKFPKSYAALRFPDMPGEALGS